MTELIDLAAGLPEITIEPGHVVVREGDASGPVFVLVSGSLRVMKNGVQVNSIERPGAMIGEVSVLLDSTSSATVEAVEPSTLRWAVDGRSFLMGDAQIMAHVARGLASRLDFVTTYLADLKHQYGDAPGLAMVGEVLQQLARRDGPVARPGSARDPDPLY